MKGALGLCLLLYIAGAKEIGADIVTTKPENGKVVKFGTTNAALLSCTTTGDFTNLIWKKGTTTELCTATDQTAGCVITGELAKLYEVDTVTKFNLKVAASKSVAYAHVGSYSCELTPTATPPAFTTEGPHTGDITVAKTPECSDIDITVQVGDTKEISCTQKYQGAAKTTLKFMLDTTEKGSTSNATKDGDESTVTLKMTVPTTKAGGLTYKCVASAADTTYTGHECTSKVTVVAKVMETKPIDTAARLEEGDVKMHCNLVKDTAGYKSVTWTKGGELTCKSVETGDAVACTGTRAADYELDTKKHDLNIKKVADASAGEYTCAVETPAVSAKAHLIPITKVSPECSKADKKVTCKVTYKGTKAPTVEWHKDDKKVTATPAVKDNVVTVEATVDDDKAYYMCKVMNGGEMAYECFGSGAPAFGSKIYQSTLLALVVVWLWHQFK